MNAFSQLLDLELERCGWTAADRKWREDAQQFIRDVRATVADFSTREAGSPNKQPAANNGHSA
jgi:hypothetical protein